MVWPSSVVLLLCLLARPSWSQAIPKNQICVSAVQQAYSAVIFEGPGYTDYYTTSCLNTLRITSIYAASTIYCDHDDIAPGFSGLNKNCEAYGGFTMLPLSSVVGDLTEEDIKNMPVFNSDEVDPTANISEPFIISQSWFDVTFRTTDTWEFELWTHVTYGWAIYAFWGGIILVGIIQRLWQVWSQSRFTHSAADTEGGSIPSGGRKVPASTGLLAPASRGYSWIHTNLVLPSSLGSYHQRLWWWCTIPTRMITLVVASFWILSLVLSCVNYRGFEGNLYWDSVPVQIWRYIADRTGIYSYATLPWIWVFSGRNNIFLWATGWQFSTFNIFHRHVARASTIAAIIHSIAYTVFYMLEDPTGELLSTDMKDDWLYLGVLATVAMSLIVFFSFSWFRRLFYDSFLLVHIVLSVMTIVALFYHTEIFMGAYDPYLWPLVAIWSFERGLRLVRLAYCNLHVGLNKGKGISHTRSNVSYDRDGNMIRIQVTLQGSHLKPRPGQHYYLYQPFRWTGYENHPFTLAYWESPKSASAAPAPLPEASAATSSQTTSDKSVPTQVNEVPAPSPDETTLEFWLRPYDGWTRHLRAACLRSPEKATISPTILLEGPYGHSHPLWTYDTVLLIAGGSGITAASPYLLDHITRKSTRTRQITLMWANRSEGFIRSVVAGPSGRLASAIARPEVRSQFFVTGSEAYDASSEGSEKEGEEESGKGEKEAMKRGTDINVMRGRPNVEEAISAAAREASESGFKVAVMVCGPAGMADAAREAAYLARKRYGDTVDYIEETFGW